MVVSEVRAHQQVQGLHIDSMVDVDSDYFTEPSVSHGILSCPGVGECGASGRVALTAADATHLLQMRRSSGKAMPHHGEVGVSHVDVNDFYVYSSSYVCVCSCLCIHVPVSCKEC